MINFRELNSENTEFSESFTAFLTKRTLVTKEVRNTVGDIITQIRNNGDEALKSLTKEFDKFEAEEFIVSEKEINAILKNFDKSLIKSFEFSFDRLINYQSTCFDSLNLVGPEREITRKFRTIDSVGMYIPGGKASYPSTVLMGSAPAIACGVKQISIASPALNGSLNPMVIAAAKVVGVDKIYKIGGAQAIAALALGTEQISKVEKIIGPGNVYVAEAKKQLFGEVGIDSIAGPSEIVVLADSTSDPETIAWDLMAQSEHDSDASSVLISTSDEITENVKTIISAEVSSLDRSSIIQESINSNGLFIKIKDLTEAKEIINKLAPEHLHIAFDHQDYEYEEELIAGLILKGRDSANSFSDYVLGPSHILPTNSSSRFSSPLSVEDFLVSYSYISLDKNKDKHFNEYVEHTTRIANAEGLTAHAIAAKKRLDI
jgi:histidinol dehydrogenase